MAEEEEVCGDEEAVCYLCLGGGVVDESDQPLRRDCACRGTDAGFVHLSCLTGFAATKSVQARLMNEFIKPWRVCPGCHQEYQNEFAIDIATEFVSFVRSHYPSSDTRRQVESLHLKLCALKPMLVRLTPLLRIEIGVTANVLLSLIDRMKNESPLTMRYSQIEAFAYDTHGLIAVAEGTEESARRAVVHYERCLKVYEAIDHAGGITTAKSNIAYAKSKYEGGNTEEMLKASQEMYELRINEFGEEHEGTIDAGTLYAVRLQKANRQEEARELLMKLLATSKQVFGSDHNITKSVELCIRA
jgi:hypothetical protein